MRIRTPAAIRREEALFYYLGSVGEDDVNERINALLVDYRVHRTLIQTEEYCGRVLEEIVQASFTRPMTMTVTTPATSTNDY